MTLITGLLTKHYVVLTSDRRISLTDKTKQEDLEVKTAVLNNAQFLMGWTGLAHPSGGYMHSWLTQQLMSHNPREWLSRLATGMDEVYRKTPGAKDLAHAFMLVGFVQEPGRAVEPAMYLVSNALTTDGYWAGHIKSDRFQVRGHPLGNLKQRLFTVGYPVPQKLHNAAYKRVRAARERDPFDPGLTAFALVDFSRAVADVSDDWVGRPMMFATLPKKVLGALDGFPLGGVGLKQAKDEPLALSIGENLEGDIDGVRYGPLLLNQGMSIGPSEIKYSAEGFGQPPPAKPPF